MKVLMTHPDLERLGGIETYVSKVLKRMPVEVTSFTVGRRFGERGRLDTLRRLLADQRAFQSALDTGAFDVVHANTSFSRRAFFREAWLLRLSKRRGARTVMFIHGWQEPFARWMHLVGRRAFRRAMANVDAVIVLSEGFEEEVRSLGYPGPIFREVTVVDDDVVAGLDVEVLMKQRRAHKRRRLVFVSRVTRAKGIYVALDTMKLLEERDCDVELFVVGDGPELSGAEAYAEAHGVHHVTFTGRVDLDRVSTLLSEGDLFFLPTMHGEGLPNVIVEAMAVGLPVVTRPVGGIADLFLTGQHGVVTESTDPGDFAALIAAAFADGDAYDAMSRNNAEYSRENLLASDASRRLAAIYSDLLEP